jgi:CelD/BcsL family acetyltransferase involved in cellulose biosynthesis
MQASQASGRFPTIIQDLETAIIDDPTRLASLEEDWSGLSARCPSVTAFQSFAWNEVWWRHHPVGLSLAIVTVRERGKLVGLGPFVVRPRGAATIIRPVGFDRYAYFGLLVLPGRDDVAQAIASALAARFSHGLLHVPYYQARDEALGMMLCCLNTLGWNSRSWVRNVCHYLHEPQGYGAFLAGKTSKARYNLKRELRLLGDVGHLEFQLYDGPKLDERIVERVAAIQARSWLARRGQESLGSFFYRELLPALARFNLADVHILTLDSRDLAFVLLYRHNIETICIYIGFDESLARLSPGKVHMHEVVKTILDRGDQVLDFHFGDGDYKRFWSNRSKYALEVVAWKGTVPYLYSWYPARLRALMTRFPRTKNAIKRVRARLRRRSGTGRHGKTDDFNPPPGAVESEGSSKPDSLSSSL